MSLFSTMAAVSVLTRQLSAMDISTKKQQPTAAVSRPTHTKQPSQPNVSKLLTKFAAPHPFSTAKPAQPSSLRNPPRQPQPQPAQPSELPSSPIKGAITTKPGMDIGRYDGGFEIDDEKRGEKVYGEAAEDLALDSSVSAYVRFCLPPQNTFASFCTVAFTQ